MNQVEQSLEQKLGQESRERELQNLYQSDNVEGLLSAAVLLNVAYSQQLVINRWLAAEAADNLGEAWQAKREVQDCYAEFVRNQNHATP